MRSQMAPLAVFLAGLIASSPTSAQQPKKTAARGPAPAVLVVVDGDPVTEADLARMMVTRQVPEDTRDKYRRPFLEEMVDARLMRRFLAEKKITANKAELDRAVQSVVDLAAQRGDPEKAMADMGYTTKSLRDELGLPIAWQQYVVGAITPAEMSKYFQAHRAEFDGTQVHARQILLRVPSKADADYEAAEKELAAIRQQIVDGKLSFEAAAKKHSQSPSSEQGGDIGWFPYSGKMPTSIAHAAFQLKPGEISQPFRSSFGVHLCQVIERKPNELFSLEDGHDEVLARLSQERWKQIVADLRKTAKIEWKVK